MLDGKNYLYFKIYMVAHDRYRKTESFKTSPNSERGLKLELVY